MLLQLSYKRTKVFFLLFFFLSLCAVLFVLGHPAGCRTLGLEDIQTTPSELYGGLLDYYYNTSHPSALSILNVRRNTHADKAPRLIDLPPRTGWIFLPGVSFSKCESFRTASAAAHWSRLLQSIKNESFFFLNSLFFPFTWFFCATPLSVGDLQRDDESVCVSIHSFALGISPFFLPGFFPFFSWLLSEASALHSLEPAGRNLFVLFTA